MPFTVLVTGASGFIASHIVAQCLEKGYKVRGTVRDPSNEEKVGHLKRLPGASENLELFAADLSTADFKEPIAGCDGVFHTATPFIFGGTKEQILDPAMASTQAILDASVAAGTVKTFVLTSSTSAMAPVPEPDVKSEMHWSDPDTQRAKGNWYGATKTLQERLCNEYVSKLPADKKFRFVAVCPTGVVGPMLGPGMSQVNGWLLAVLKGTAMKDCKNDSMSWVDVRDCAAIHVAAMENDTAEGRYMCVESSLHWNDIVKMLKELCPTAADVKPFGGDLVKPTTFNRSRQDSLGVAVRPVRDIFEGVIETLKARGVLPV
mmetsp:Transcript_2899/g.6897  ORF Transcript_2899/g.6897 Transcript_2899/m.6897 type:complete len:319 (-) Transcript_2899:139-1095(-)